MTVTVEQLTACMAPTTPERCRVHLDGVNLALAYIGATTTVVTACFLAQIGHESAGLRYTEEIASGAAYEGRGDLGNTQRGDGVRFKGRGLIQVTGRSNYAACGRALGIDAIANPQLLATPVYAARSAAWFWRSHNLNRFATISAFDELTRRINGGQNGRPDRLRRLKACLAALQAPHPAAKPALTLWQVGVDIMQPTGPDSALHLSPAQLADLRGRHTVTIVPHARPSVVT